MPDRNEWNRKVIEEFRANDGTVGGDFAGFSPLLPASRRSEDRGGARQIPVVVLEPAKPS